MAREPHNDQRQNRNADNNGDEQDRYARALAPINKAIVALNTEYTADNQRHPTARIAEYDGNPLSPEALLSIPSSPPVCSFPPSAKLMRCGLKSVMPTNSCETRGKPMNDNSALTSGWCLEMLTILVLLKISKSRSIGEITDKPPHTKSDSRTFLLESCPSMQVFWRMETSVNKRSAKDFSQCSRAPIPS